MSTPPPKDARIVRLVRPAMLDGKPVEKPKEPDAVVEVRVTTKQPLPPTPTPETPPPIKKRKKGEPVDWQAMQPFYCAGVLSNRQIGEMFGVSHTAVANKAKELGWERDLSDRIAAHTERKMLVATAELSNPVAVESRKLTENALVETWTDAVVKVRMGQNERFARVAKLCMNMFEELEEQVAARPLLNELADLMVRPNEQGIDRLNDIYRKVIEFPGQVRAMKDLADVIGQLTAWETRAFRLDSAPLGDGGKRKNLTVRFIEATPMVERVDDEPKD